MSMKARFEVHENNGTHADLIMVGDEGAICNKSVIVIHKHKDVSKADFLSYYPKGTEFQVKLTEVEKS